MKGIQRHGRHQSVDPALRRKLTRLESQVGVKKLVLGLSEACRHRYGPGTLRFMGEVHGGIRINGYSGNGIVRITLLYADDITPEQKETIRKMIV